MTTHIHHLAGCSPVPLAHYLKALGVLRLVAEQADPQVRGWWRDESFHLSTRLNAQELMDFFLRDYHPTPLIAPWNGGSGFYPKDNKSGIDAIAKSKASRLSEYRQAIELGRQATAHLAERPKEDAKIQMIQQCRRTWRGSLLSWLDAALVLSADGSPSYPALLGTGGNDGRLDFTNNFMQRVSELFDCEEPLGPARQPAIPLLASSLFREATSSLAKGKAVGQFLPGGAGGANGTTGFGSDSLVNPWDFILLMEGTIFFAASLSRRSLTDTLPQASAPFAVRATAVGYGSMAVADEGARGEQWMPLWDRPATAREIVFLISEGRSQIHNKPAQRPVDFARAIACLGVARGITAFQRFGYIERNGQANLATPLGRWRVEPQPHQDLIDQISPWVDRLRRDASDNHAPTSIARAVRNCEEAMLACCRGGRNPQRWQELLMALGDAQAQLITSPRFTTEKNLRPLPSLSANWLQAADDGSVELRLALALAAQFGISGRGDLDWQDSVRRHFLPLDESGQFHTGSNGLVSDTRVVCSGKDLQRDALALVRRRVVEAGRSGQSHFPLAGFGGTEAVLSDVAAFIAGNVDDARILSLAQPLMALKWKGFSSPLTRPRASSADSGVLALYGPLRLTHCPRPIPLQTGAIRVRLDPAIFARLATGDLTSAITMSARRLTASGLRPHFNQVAAEPALTLRLSASLAFPIADRDAVILAGRLTRAVNQEPPYTQDNPTTEISLNPNISE